MIDNAVRVDERTMQVLSGVREYVEELAVQLYRHKNGRTVVRAFNEAGYNEVKIDLEDLLEAIGAKVAA